MGQGDFGFSSLNSNLNSNNNNGFGISNMLLLENLIVSVRVKSIVLDDTHPRFKELGGWTALGAIEYELVKNPVASSRLSVAYPLYPNIKNYPLLEEITYVISLPNTGIGENNSSEKTYYMNVAVWNHPHHNAYPTKSNIVQPSQNKSYNQTQAGSSRTTSNEPVRTFLGKTFKERANIHPLLPFEGDIIYEGRWGNSIRLGSTVQNTPNNWSSTSLNGDPITIIRNGQGSQTDEGWLPIVENINNDDSSIYLTSTQNVPLNVAASSYVSYNKDKAPTSPSKYSGAQVILDSGRLVFNAYSDHILLSSAKSINLNSLESVNIDTKKFITQADQIFLGKEDLATEPLLLGNTTVQLLKDLITSFKEITNTLKTLESAPVPPNSPATFPSLLIPSSKVLTTLESLEKQLGTSPENCTITSKRNFTL